MTKPPELKPGQVPGRCNAKARQSPTGFCRNWPITDEGCTRCRMHAGHSQGKPSVALTTGVKSRFVRVDQLRDVAEIAAALMTADGRAALTATRAAVAEVRLREVPEQDHSTFLAYGEALRRDQAAIADELDTKAVGGEVVFQIQSFGTDANCTVLCRLAEHADFPASVDNPGTVNVRFIDGAPYLIHPATGAMVPARKLLDEETGADVYTLLGDL